MAENTPVIVSGARTPIGSFLGSLKDVKAQTLGAIAIREAIRRANIADGAIDEVIIGNLFDTESHGNIAREALLEAGLPHEIPAFTVQKNCASSLKSVAQAALSILAGEAEVVLAGGLESMSRYPHAVYGARTGLRMGHGEMVDTILFSLEGMGLTAERLAEKYGISRAEQDAFAAGSQRKAAAAQTAGKFDAEIVPVPVPQRKGEPVPFTRDEGVRPDTTVEILAKLRPVFKQDGTVTAGNSSTINDGAAALVLMSEKKARELGCAPLVRIKAWASAGCDPDLMGIGPVPAVKKLLTRTGMALTDFDLVELNEAFAAQSLAVLRELAFDPARVNVSGGAIATGHPTGATGSILVVKLMHEMLRRGAGTGLVTLCIGGGQGMALALERVVG
jgi:acetyl-CoA C-acetyltransferase